MMEDVIGNKKLKKKIKNQVSPGEPCKPTLNSQIYNPLTFRT